MAVELLPLTLETPYLDEAIAIYNEYLLEEGASYTTESNRAFFRAHIKRDGFIGLLARTDERIIGLIFGSPSKPGQWWHDRVAQMVGGQHPALQNAFVLTQLNILKCYRNRGIGLLLHNALLAKQPYPHVLLSTQVANKAAQRFYLRHGWHFLHAGFAFSPGDQPYAIMAQTIQK